ncbi:Ubiquinol-cytochrome C reductase hinge protein [Teladorsagia circumcincta]|uniref:Cytochrome b-c1 complex subunit 6 n=1 Tax=Teladorsagia circumcincta TaxID=45464 RepID=A0A2G9UTG4_TELCI|nr:Ubiquinol-cytochrome C reductase hinge protein [Teladorsagia circumcincta]
MAEKEEPLEVGVDQLKQWRDRCAEKFPHLKTALDECNARVSSRKETAETCVQELWDFVEQVDRCAVHKAFAALK